MKSIVVLAVVGVSAGLADADILYDTGPHDTVWFNNSETNLGWTSGNAGATQPQRWTAQPFTLTEPSHVEAIVPSFFVPGATPTGLSWIVWNRNGEDAPVDGDQVASGTSAFIAPGADTYASIPVAFDLPAGDYYVTVYAEGSTIGWFTNAPNPINFQDSAGASWMWRSEMFPAPGFAVYQLDPSVLDVVDPNVDSRDFLYSADFRIEGTIIPAPGGVALLGLGAVGAMRRRR